MHILILKNLFEHNNIKLIQKMSQLKVLYVEFF